MQARINHWQSTSFARIEKDNAAEGTVVVAAKYPEVVITKRCQMAQPWTPDGLGCVLQRPWPLCIEDNGSPLENLAGKQT